MRGLLRDGPRGVSRQAAGADDPAALDDERAALGGPSGRCSTRAARCAARFTVPPGESVRLVFATGVAETRDAAVRLTEKYSDPRSAQRAIDLAWTAAQLELRDLGISPAGGGRRSSGSRRDSCSPTRTRRSRSRRRSRTACRCRACGRSASRATCPILLVRVEELEHAPLVRQALLAHQYWRHKGLVADLVILNTRPTGYADELDDRLRLLVRTGHALQLLDKPGGVFLRRTDQMHPDVLNLLLSVARATLDGDGGTIELQLNRRGKRPPRPIRSSRRAQARFGGYFAPSSTRPELMFDNGYGGFDPKTGEYVIVLEGDLTTPAPWIDVLASPEFGCTVSEAGVGCTWALNSHENRITTWNNDPGHRRIGEAIYVRDEETGEFWSPTPLPVRTPGALRHPPRSRPRDASSTRRTASLTSCDWFIPPSDPIRICRLELTNTGSEPRQALGHAVRRVGSRRLAVAGAAARGDVVRCRDRHAHRSQPPQPRLPRAAARSSRATGRSRAGPRAAPSSSAATVGRATPPPWRAKELGRVERTLPRQLRRAADHASSSSRARARRSRSCSARPRRSRRRVSRRAPPRAGRTRRRARGCEHVLGRPARHGPGRYARRPARLHGQRLAALPGHGVSPLGPHGHVPVQRRVRLPRPAAGRARAARRSTGPRARADRRGIASPVPRGRRAALVAAVLRPRRAHAHLRRPPLAAARRRRVPLGDWRRDRPRRTHGLHRGTAARRSRTRTPTCSRRSRETAATVYEHCMRALETGRPVGVHGLPLMGGGDWNDGMNRVGHEGKGESVWLAWFLIYVLWQFAPIVESRGEAELAADYRAWSERLRSGRRGARLGRRVVSARLLRRRHTARHAHRRGVPNRRDRASMGDHLGRRRSRARRDRSGVRRGEARPPRRPPDRAARAALRPDGCKTPATSRATSPACARTAASTRTARCGLCSPT